MIIALDFDDTFTSLPKEFAAFVHLAQDAGHEVYCVTARKKSFENEREIREAFAFHNLSLPIIFCNEYLKRETMEKLGIYVDVWIDDSPNMIIEEK